VIFWGSVGFSDGDFEVRVVGAWSYEAPFSGFLCQKLLCIVGRKGLISEVTPSLFVNLSGHTFLPIISRVTRDNQKLVYSLVNSSCLYVLSRKFISHITLTFMFNLMSHAEYIVLCGVPHLVTIYII
jgi:hypothetical protein